MCGCAWRVRRGQGLVAGQRAELRQQADELARQGRLARGAAEGQLARHGMVVGNATAQLEAVRREVCPSLSPPSRRMPKIPAYSILKELKEFSEAENRST